MKRAVLAMLLALTCPAVMLAPPALTQETEDPAQALLDSLLEANPQTAPEIEERVWSLWLESGSPTVDVLMERGIVALEAGELELARDMFDRAVIIRPNFAEAWNRRATVFFLQDDYVDAVQDLEQALKHEPRHFGAWTGLGLIFENLGATAKAVEAFDRALAIHPNLEVAKQARSRLGTVSSGRQM
jgi:tetratricopeptide (TPR) repeat protein